MKKQRTINKTSDNKRTRTRNKLGKIAIDYKTRCEKRIKKTAVPRR